MPEPKQQTPSIGRIVLYRAQDGRDHAAIITELLPEPDFVPELVTQGGDRVHLHIFWQRSGRQDYIHPEYGIPHASEPTGGCWRWPERV